MLSGKLHSKISKPEVFAIVEQAVVSDGLVVETIDSERPWGGFLVISEAQIARFVDLFFPKEKLLAESKGLKFSPKILVVAPQSRLSWQYHFRRSEIWKVVDGPVKVVRSQTDTYGEEEIHHQGSLIKIATEMRHRLAGHQNWGIVAEIWQHSDKNNPSNEEDIVRLADDFGRK